MPTSISSILATAATKDLASLGHCRYSRNTTYGECCVDSGSTEHMFLDYSSFLSYCPSTYPNDYALLGDESCSNIAGHGTAVFTMNGCYILVRNALHVPSLWAPLYSTQSHRTQPGCAYYDDDTIGNLLLFPTMVINVDSTTDNIVSFRPIGRSLRD